MQVLAFELKLERENTARDRENQALRLENALLRLEHRLSPAADRE